MECGQFQYHAVFIWIGNNKQINNLDRRSNRAVLRQPESSSDARQKRTGTHTHAHTWEPIKTSIYWSSKFININLIWAAFISDENFPLGSKSAKQEKPTKRNSLHDPSANKQKLNGISRSSKHTHYWTDTACPQSSLSIHCILQFYQFRFHCIVEFHWYIKWMKIIK